MKQIIQFLYFLAMVRHCIFQAIPVLSPLLLVSLIVLLRTHILLKPVKIVYLYIVVSQIIIIIDKKYYFNKQNKLL